MMRKIPVEIRVRNRVPVCELLCPLMDDMRSTECCRECVYFDSTVYGAAIICMWAETNEKTVY